MTLMTCLFVFVRFWTKSGLPSVCLTASFVLVWSTGYEKYNTIRADPALCFLERVGRPDEKAIAAEQRGNDFMDGWDEHTVIHTVTHILLSHKNSHQKTTFCLFLLWVVPDAQYSCLCVQGRWWPWIQACSGFNQRRYGGKKAAEHAGLFSM